MMRKPTNRKVDRRIFKSTADRVKSVNIYPTQMRGGYRF